jgi:hypothetical protein
MAMMGGLKVSSSFIKSYLIIVVLVIHQLFGFDFSDELEIAGNNRFQIQKALNSVPENHGDGMNWLIKHMPKHDLKIVSSDFLLDNCELAYSASKKSTWGGNIPDSIFLEYVLPFGNLNEKRDNWRRDFYNRFNGVMKKASSAYEAATILNNTIFDILGVKYSTERPKADQSPYESIEAGLASCTGLSILLIDACRSIGIPARFVGTRLWYNNSGNHSWVEIWDDGWHYTGAAEPSGNDLNKVWFSGLASRAVKGHPKYGIYAATWGKKQIHFPMDWLPGLKIYNAVDVTETYTENVNDNLIPIRIKVTNLDGQRQSTNVTVTGADNFLFEGLTNSESNDANDHLTLMLPIGKIFSIGVNNIKQTITVTKEELIDLKI